MDMTRLARGRFRPLRTLGLVAAGGVPLAKALFFNANAYRALSPLFRAGRVW